MNQQRGDGGVIRYEIVPFANGEIPTQPPVSVLSASNDESQLTSDQHNLPYLGSVNAIENLNENQLAAYLNGYGIVPPAGADPATTDHWQKQTLKRLIGVSYRS